MRIFVTGGRGFLGRQVIGLAEGCEVLRLVRTPDEVPAAPFVRDVVGALEDPATWTATVADFAPDCCLHLAWDGLPDYSLDKCRQNLDANLRMMDALGRAGVSRIVVAGSCWEYGFAQGAQTEDAEAVDPGVFASTKTAVRLMLDSVARERGLQYRWARIFFSYGPGQREQSLIPSLRTALRSGQTPGVRQPAAAQDFIHVDDVARGLLSLAAYEGASGVFNLGTGRPVTVAEVANLVAAHYGAPALFDVQPAVSGMWADLTRVRAATGWQPTIALDAGVTRTLRELDAVA